MKRISLHPDHDARKSEMKNTSRIPEQTRLAKRSNIVKRSRITKKFGITRRSMTPTQSRLLIKKSEMAIKSMMAR